MTERMERRAHECGLACAEIAEQVDMQAAVHRLPGRSTRTQCGRETFAECDGRGFVRQIELPFADR
jgi:hypothetical protein